MIIEKKDKKEFISTYIELIGVLYKGKVKYLRPREIEFLANCAIVRSDGIDLVSLEATKRLKKDMNLSTDNDVHVYRNKLKKKKWLIQTKDSIILPKMFDKFINGIPKETLFKFNLSWKD